MNFENLSIIDLLGELDKARRARRSGVGNNYAQEIEDELWKREPFVYISERLDEDNEELETLRKEVIELKRLLKNHEHLRTGEAVVEID